ncbi:MAG: AI-2E family transporter [Chloroflexi bacterium]|nr:AI-2E family transporter [Chloroflexota bacterium]
MASEVAFGRMAQATETGTTLTPRQRLAGLAIVAALVLALLVLIRGVLPPFIWAIVAAYVLTPVVNWLEYRTRLPRVAVVLCLYAVLFFLIGALVATIRPVVAYEIADLRESSPRLTRELTAALASSELLQDLGVQVEPNVVHEAMSALVKELASGAVHAVTWTVEAVAKLIMFLVATFYLIVDSRRIGESLRSLVPPRLRPEIFEVAGQVHSVLGRYIRGQLFLVALMSTVTWIALSPILQVKYAVVISFATGFLELFPIVGPLTAGAIACTVGFFQVNAFGWSPLAFAGVIALVYFALRHAEDYVVIPNVIGRVVELHPLIVLFSLFAGASIGGIQGMFLAVPTAAVLKIIGAYLYRKLVSE